MYTKEDDKAIETLCRERVSTTWHGLGTLAMKPRDKGGVVDKELNVYGVENLKVIGKSIILDGGFFFKSDNLTHMCGVCVCADLSICPGNGENPLLVFFLLRTSLLRTNLVPFFFR